MEVLDELDREMRNAAFGCLYGVKEWPIRSLKETDGMLKGGDRFLRKSW